MKKLKIFIFLILISYALETPGFTEPILNNVGAPSFYNDGDFPSALNEYQKQADKGDIEGYLNEAVIYKDIGDYKNAEEVLNKAPGEFKSNKKLLLLLGRIYYLDGKNDEAIEILKKVLNSDAHNLEANTNIGLSYEDKGSANEAKKFYRNAVSIDRNYLLPHLKLAGLYMKSGKWKEALDEYMEVRRIDPSIESVYKDLAGLHLRNGNKEEALKAYKKVNLIEPGNKSILEKINKLESEMSERYRSTEKEKRSMEKKLKKILVMPASFQSNAIIVRIGLVQNIKSVEFKCSSPFLLRKRDGKVISGHRLGGENYKITANGKDGMRMTHEAETALSFDTIHDAVIIEPENPAATVTIFNTKLGKNNFWSSEEDRSYRGRLEIRVAKESLTIINMVSLEEYLYSVVPSEMPSHWPREALKAQAIAARTEAIYKLGRHKSEGFDLCSGTHCQVYTGVEQENEPVNKIVDETQGILMTYNRKPIDAVYSSSCGGHTQNNIFGDKENIPYLKGRPDLPEEADLRFPLSPLEFERWVKDPPKNILCGVPQYSSSAFRWTRIYTAKELNEMINKKVYIGDLKEILILKREVSGHVSALKIVGTRSSLFLEKELDIRKTFGNLRSSLFKVEAKLNSDKTPEQFIFFGGGWGHGVGLCQTGAASMALQGKNAGEILNHYYDGIDLSKSPALN